MAKERLDVALARRGVVPTRSQAESFIKLGSVKVNGRIVTKPGAMIDELDDIQFTAKEQYVSRAGLKLASVAKTLGLNFRGKVMLDVGSSTGGFTDYALQHGAVRVIAVDVGTDQLHPSLRGDERIELHEQTDVRSLKLRSDRSSGVGNRSSEFVYIDDAPDIVVIDVSFISLREILPSVISLSGPTTQIVAMVKPQFEAIASSFKHKGVIKNDRMRRDILKSFEQWALANSLVIIDKADSHIPGSKGNLERFYLLKVSSKQGIRGHRE